MATTVYLSNPALTINAVDLTDQATSATLTFAFDQLETTAFGQTARVFGASTVTSLQNNTFEVELYQSYAATETEASYLWFGWYSNRQSRFHQPPQVWQRRQRDRTKIRRLQALILPATPRFRQRSESSVHHHAELSPAAH
jgi:hypothetical protein